MLGQGRQERGPLAEEPTEGGLTLQLTALDAAQSYLGVRERTAGDTAYVVAWLSDCALEDAHDEVPWCSAFVNGVVRIFGGRVPRSGSASARSWLRVGRRVSLDDARPGWDVVIFNRGDGPQPGPEVVAAPGHVAFFVRRAGPPAGRFVSVLGGNQAGSVSYATFPEARVLAVQRLSEET